MINYKIENISAADFYLKELSLELVPAQIIDLTSYSWPLLANAQSIKDGLTGLTVNFYVDNILLSVLDAINYLTYSTGGAVGEVNTASNVGTGSGVFKQKSGVDLELRSIVAGSNMTITQTADEITFDASGGSGEVNTASNVGAGSGVFKQKSGVDLELRSIVAGSNMTITQTADEITFDASGGSGEVNTASNLGAGEGVFAQKTAQDLEFKSVVAGSGISLASTATELTVTSTSAGIPLVDDDAARDAAYPSPTNNLKVFNKRQGFIETYNSFYDLWISAGMNVCVEDSTVQVVAPQKVVYIVPTAATIGGVEFPILGYPSASAERNVTQGVVTRRGAATANPNQTYIAVHHFGVYYVDYGAAVTIGFNVYPRTAGVGDVISAAFAQTGTIGQAIENSGSNPSFPNSVLVSLQQRR